ncbi:hypothetical protein Bca4012_094865 [Brassica carinata]
MGRSNNRFGNNRSRGYSTWGRGFHQQISMSNNNSQSSDSSNRPTCQCKEMLHQHYFIVCDISVVNIPKDN